MRSDSGARRGLRAFVAVMVINLTLGGILVAGASAAAPPTNKQRAQRGAQWLANQIKANNGPVKNFGVADVQSTAYAVIGMRAAGVDKPASDLAISYLRTQLGAPLKQNGQDAPAALAQYILAAVADNQDPRHFGGTGSQNNLVARLLATARTTGPHAGLFGVQQPTYDGAYRQGLALAALKAAHVPGSNPRVEPAIAWLVRQQCTNGLWQPFRSNPVVVCAPANPNTFTGPDTNSTGMAVQGLAAWGRRPKQATVIQSLKKVQSANAGFPFIAAPNQSSDPNSTALVIQALIAEKSPPSATMWMKGTKTPYTALASYQLGCANPGRGAFFYPPNTTPNVFATIQAVPAMAGKALPVATSTANTIVSIPAC